MAPQWDLAWLSIGLAGVWGLFGLVGRSWVHRRRTGRTPLRRGAGPGGWIAVAVVTAAFLAGAIDELAFGASRLVNSGWLAGFGVAIAIVGLMAFLWAQAVMGDSLRIGVDPAERTALVTKGPFGLVRNPIYTSMMVYVVGIALMVPNLTAIVAAGAFVAAEEFQVRRVEEPYLTTVNRDEYLAYAATVGRFLPAIGRLRANTTR